MDWNNLKAGKKAAEDHAPDPIHNQPEAPIISEDEAQIVEDPDGQGPDPRIDEEAPDDVRRQAGNSGNSRQGGIRVTPKDDDRR